MDIAYKLLLLFLFIFILLSNAKADKSITEEGIFYGNNFSSGSHYNLVLHG